VAMDEVNNELLVVNRGIPNSVTVYPRTAYGNFAPLRTISGVNTTLFDPRGMAIDVVNNELAVVNYAGTSVTIFARAATGNATPLRTITGGSTNLSLPTGIALDAVNNQWVVANSFNAISSYARTANGDAVPQQFIFGSNTGFDNGPIGVTVDTVHNELAVTNPMYGAFLAPSVLVFARSDNGNVAPMRAIVGAATGLAGANGLVVDSVNNELLVANSLNNSVTIYLRTADGDVAPLRTLVGAATRLSNPQFLAIATSMPAFANAMSRKVHGGVGTFDLPLLP